ncbi:monovalent cation/H+ antiporter complex subunit F [Halanaerobacter jeridensis]|mgnify:FL=1|uniref:Multicomponent Na+:H+ antiporter subunit F n=1 Tax=Halanaerobacter jeridensis TaxID=706427 RepID=A0A938XSF0_9FIRM|nr:monovalent cation/H+ antiporter complex subunit F [Halanaerobacter jeridensis]MBM7556645.1 multicomponent Na+:H+ antiporter subunit F [Halanaerobacter jeridensis]
MIEIIMIAILLAIAMTFYRVLKGPTVFDRIAAADTIGIMFLLILVLLSLYFEREIFIDVAIVFALLLFTDTLIMAKYFSN